MKKKFFTPLVVLAMIALGFGISHAYSSYLTTFNNTYGTSATVLNTCGLCHIDPAGGGARNPYGIDFMNYGHNFKTIEPLDSDADGYSNITEINARTFPGDATSHPTSAGADTTPPTVTAFTIPATSSSLTVPITVFAATDNVGVTGYMVTGTATQPASGAAGWTASFPASYTAATAGTKTLYAFAKDAAGNVSVSKSATVTITLPTPSPTPTPTPAPTPAPTPMPGSAKLIAPASSGLVWDDTNKWLGIGTTSPITNLHVEGFTPAFAVLDTQSTNASFYSNWTDYAQLSVNRNPSTGVFTDVNKAGAQLSIYGGPNDSQFHFYTASSNNTTPLLRVVIDKVGNVGIGTSSPVYPLQMGSGAYVSPGGVWTNASSRTYKDNIKDLSEKDAVDAFMKLNPVTYSYKKDADDKHVGFIAEDVPDLVATKNRKGLSPMDIVAVVTKVVQQQQKTIEEQQKTISALSKKVADLQREIKPTEKVASAGLAEPGK